MARARMLKPDFFRDEELAELPIEGRMLFAGLWTIADRKGRLEYRAKRIKADIFPYDSIEVEMLLNKLDGHGFITIYEVKGVKYIQINNFCKHQHPHPKEPDSCIPDISESDMNEPAAKHLQNIVLPTNGNGGPLAKRAESESLTESESESFTPPSPKARRGKSTSCLAPGFLAFWDAWPKHSRKAAKVQCHRHWMRHGLETAAPEILASVGAWKISGKWAEKNGEYIPAPLTFLGQRRWEAPPPTPPPCHATDLAIEFNDVHTPEFLNEVLPE